MIKLFQVLFLCHTVQINIIGNQRYQASSPDEFSFVMFCTKLGIVYEGEEKDPDSSAMIRKIQVKGQLFKYKMLQILEFDTTRKRMSVIVEDMQTNEIVLFCKGAESCVFPHCSEGDILKCQDAIDDFARKGWRTFALAYKTLTKSYYSLIEKKVNKASVDLLRKDVKLKRLYNKIESNLKLLGASAVEDKLQEGVTDTLESLRQAGIKIWVLTGDKIETAIKISHSCKHFSNEMTALSITDLNSEQLEKRIKIFQKE